MTITSQVRQIEIFGHSIRVSVRRTGGGTPLLLFNGIGSNLELLQPFIESLGDIETVVFDIPGVGASSEPLLPYRLFNMARLADQLMTKLGYEGEFDVFGVSWGGALAQQFAFQYRRRCRKLVLAATSQGVLMVPGRFRSMLKMLSARRLGDPDYLSKIGPELYGGAMRVRPAPDMPINYDRPEVAATCTRCCPHGVGPAFGGYPGCGNPRSYSPAQTTLSCLWSMPG